MSRKKVRT